MKTDTIIVLLIAFCVMSTPVMALMHALELINVDTLLIFAPWMFVAFVVTICLAAFGFLMIQSFSSSRGFFG